MQEYKDAVREHLSSYVCQLRQRRGLTQEEMAEKLRITARAYGDLERGKFCFSAPALMALLLILKEDEVAELLNDFRKIEALRLSLREPDRLLLVTKHVYPDVARCFDTNWKCVERGLRRAANVAWNTAPEKLSELAHRHLTEKPSVSELLSLLTIYLRAEEEN